MTRLTKFERLAQRLVVLFALAGCGTGTRAPEPSGPSTASDPTDPAATDPTTTTPAALVAEIAANLDRLRALEVVNVGAIVISSNAQRASCYSLPCALDESDPVVTEYRRQAPRLAVLVDQATRISMTPELPQAPADTVAADVDALRRLEIVTTTGLITSSPAASPTCYNLPCPADIERAAAQNQRRSDVVHALAAATASDSP